MVHDSDVDQVVAQVQTKMVLRGLAPLTIETYVRCIRRFIARVGKPLAAVKAKDELSPFHWAAASPRGECGRVGTHHGSA